MTLVTTCRRASATLVVGHAIAAAHESSPRDDVDESPSEEAPDDDDETDALDVDATNAAAPVDVLPASARERTGVGSPRAPPPSADRSLDPRPPRRSPDRSR